MTCADVMKRQPQTVRESDTIRQAAEKMAASNVGFLPVCDDAGKVLGTLTDRDIAIRAVAKGLGPEQGRVGQVMSREVIACRSGDDLSAAERLMAQHQKSRILVTGDAGQLEGVISLSDVVEREPDQQAAATLRQVAAREART